MMASFTPQVPPQFPNGLLPFELQIGSDDFEPGTNSVGFLKNANETLVLKPLGEPGNGASEKGFYEMLQNTTDFSLQQLKKLVPRYYGMVQMTVNERELYFIKLKNLTYGMQKPCIMDIEIVNPLVNGINDLEPNLGLSIRGFQVYNFSTGKLERYKREPGKLPNGKKFKDNFKLFLNFGVGLWRSLVCQMLYKLYDMEKWEKKQTTIVLTTSSILIVYDAERFSSFSPGNFNEMGTNSEGQENSTFQQEYDVNYYAALTKVRVKIIGFANVNPITSSIFDVTYLVGIIKLRKLLESILEEAAI